MMLHGLDLESVASPSMTYDPELCRPGAFQRSRGRAYKGWNVLFEALGPRILVNYQLASGLSDFDASGFAGNTEFVGCSRYCFGIADASQQYRAGYHIEVECGKLRTRDRALTKKMQTQVMRLLKPFIRGTWKSAPAVRS
jgi:hypothetical protein